MYGREKQLYQLNKDRNDPTKPMVARKWADAAHRKIVNQLKDRKLMAMRERLIKATRAGDKLEMNKIQAAMKAHEKQDRETYE